MLGFKVDDSQLQQYKQGIESAKSSMGALASVISEFINKANSAIGGIQGFDTINTQADEVASSIDNIGKGARVTVEDVDSLIDSIEQVASEGDDLNKVIGNFTKDGLEIKAVADGYKQVGSAIPPVTEEVGKLGERIKDTTAKIPPATEESKKYNETIKDQAKAHERVADTSKGFIGSLIKAQMIMGVTRRIVGAAFSFVRDSVIGATAEIERYRVTLGTMIGDQEKANEIIHNLDYSAVSDFYGTANSVGGLQNLISFGMEAEKASDLLTNIGDIALGNTETFSSMSNLMGKVFSKGKAEGIELKQFMLKGVDIVGIIAKNTGKAREAIEKQGVSYEDVAQALKSLTSEGGAYYKMLEKQSNSLGGIIKQFNSFRLATAEAIGLGINDNLKELLKYILEIGRAGQEAFAGKFIAAINEVIHWIWQIIIMWKVLGYRLADMGDALAPVKKFFLDLKDAAGDVLTGIMILAVELGKLVIAAFKPIQAFASPIIKELGAIAKDVFTAIAGFIRPLVPVVSESAGFFGVLGRAVAGLLRPALTVALAIKGINTALAIREGVKKFQEGISIVRDGLSALKSGNLLKLSMDFQQLGIGQKAAMRLTETFGLLTGKVDLATAAANKNRLAMLAQGVGAVALRVKKLALAAADKIATVAQGIFNTVIAANPIMLIVLGIAALIAGIVLLVKNWDKVSAVFRKTGKAIGGFFASAGGKIKSFASSIGEKVGRAFAPMKEKAGEVAKKLVGAFAERFPNIYALIVDVIDKVKQIFGKLVEIVKPVFEAAINVFKTVFSSAIDVVKAIGSGIFSVIKTVFFSIYDVVKTIFTSIWNVIKSVFDAVKNVVLSIVNVFKTVFLSVWTIIKGVFSTIFNTIFDTLDGVIGIWRDGGSFFENLWDSIKLIFTNAWNAILSIGKIIADAFIAVWDSVKNVFIAIFQGIAGVFSTIWQGIVNTFSVYIESIKNIFSSIVTAFAAVWAKVKAGVIKIISAFMGLWKAYINALKAVFNILVSFFSGLWNGIKAAAIAVFKVIKTIVTTYVKIWITIFKTIAAFFVRLWGNIVKGAKAAWNGLKTFFSTLVNWIKAIFSTIAGFFVNLWNGIVSIAKTIWNGLVSFFLGVVEGWETIFGALGEFFSGLWDGIVSVAKLVWSALSDWFSGLIEEIKGVWNGIIGFFSGLWDAIMQGPTTAIEYIKNAFFGLFNSLQEKLFGFINKIKEGWESVKGFFGGIADGAVNFFTGGGSNGGVDQMQPAYAGASQSAMAGKVGPTSSYAYNSTGGSPTVNAQTSINVNVPQGTSQEQSEAIARQVSVQFDERLAGSINSSRANIPSPEVRRR